MSPPTRLVLIRHGEVAEPYHRVFGGRIDMELSARGQHQAAVLAQYLQGQRLDRIYASPMRRAQHTLVPLAPLCPEPPVTCPELREVDFGDWTGLTWEQVHARYGQQAFRWLDLLEAGAIPNGETGAACRARLEPCLQRILTMHPGQTVAVVCHGGVIRVVLAMLLDLPLPKTAAFQIDYASITRVERHMHRTELTLLNFAPWRELA